MTKAEQTYFTYPTPLGPMTLASDGTAVTHVLFGTHVLEGRAAPSELTNRTANELQEYLAGKRTAFDIPLAPAGTDFQRAVWKALQNIPYGQTRSYADIAAVVGNPKATRAVGSANNRNPIAVLIPCHRVVGANGKLTGYAGGLALKQRLLRTVRNAAKAFLPHAALFSRALRTPRPASAQSARRNCDACTHALCRQDGSYRTFPSF